MNSSRQLSENSEGVERMRRRHLASLTASEMVMLNLEQLQGMGRFAYEVVLSQDEDNKIYAYQYENNSNCYLLLVPLSFYRSTKNKCKSFVQMLCLSSVTISVSFTGSLLQQITELLNQFCFKWRHKKGNTLCKIYLTSECWVNYLDFVTYQAIQFKGKSCKDLLAMKKSNGYQYCLTYFRQQIIPQIFNSRQDSIQQMLETGLEQARQIYDSLVCLDRFEVIYEIMNENTHTFRELEKQIQAIVLSRHITTVGDEEYEEIINSQLGVIMAEQLKKYEEKLRMVNDFEQQMLFVKILQKMITKLRNYHFDINDQKYLFMTTKIIEKIYSLKQKQNQTLKRQNQQMFQLIDSKNTQIQSLKWQLQQIKQKNSAKSSIDLEPIKQQNDDKESVKHFKSQKQLAKTKTSLPITIKDLKEPLQVMNSNGVSQKTITITDKNSSAFDKNKTLSKIREKAKQNLKRRQSENRSSKNLRTK